MVQATQPTEPVEQLQGEDWLTTAFDASYADTIVFARDEMTVRGRIFCIEKTEQGDLLLHYSVDEDHYILASEVDERADVVIV